MNELFFAELLAKASTFKLRRCRCNILFDVTTEGFRAHDKINNHSCESKIKQVLWNVERNNKSTKRRTASVPEK